MGGAIRANVMDRLLQFDLDRAYGNDPALKRQLCEALACTVEGIEAGFVDAETLERWRLVTLDVAGRTMDWERMRGMIANPPISTEPANTAVITTTPVSGCDTPNQPLASLLATSYGSHCLNTFTARTELSQRSSGLAIQLSRRRSSGHGHDDE